MPTEQALDLDPGPGADVLEPAALVPDDDRLLTVPLDEQVREDTERSVRVVVGVRLDRKR